MYPEASLLRSLYINKPLLCSGCFCRLIILISFNFWSVVRVVSGERQTDRQTDRQTETERQRQRDSERQRETQTERQRERVRYFTRPIGDDFRNIADSMKYGDSQLAL